MCNKVLVKTEGFGTFGTFFFLQTMLPKIMLRKQTENDQYAWLCRGMTQCPIDTYQSYSIEIGKGQWLRFVLITMAMKDTIRHGTMIPPGTCNICIGCLKKRNCSRGSGMLCRLTVTMPVSLWYICRWTLSAMIFLKYFWHRSDEGQLSRCGHGTWLVS